MKPFHMWQLICCMNCFCESTKGINGFDRSRCDRCSWMHRCFQHEIYTDYVSLSSSYQYFALALWMDLSAGSDQLYLYDHTVLGKFSGRTKDKKGGKINADICDPDRLCGFAFMFIFKVPVFISVFAGALVYFLLGASSSPAILAQRIISGT